MTTNAAPGEKFFNDAVHGVIQLPPLCVKVVDTPQFQRLRFIKQLGTCYLVYPSSCSNRFEHSIGVCHIAGQLARALQSRQPELKISNEDVLSVQLAGLCHDLGHGPFSHLWEAFVNKARPENKWTHESASIQMFNHLIKVNNLEAEFRKYSLEEEDILFIKELIDGPRDSSAAAWPYKGRTSDKAFLYEIVSNKRTGVDVDKWDYFLRDSHSLGIKVTFDYYRLLHFSRVIDFEGEGLQICYQDKEVDTLYDMFHTRRTLHRTAYQHRVVKIIDLMLVDAFCYADKHIHFKDKEGKIYYLADVCYNMDAYTNLVDDVFHQIIRAEGEHQDLMKAKEIIERILTRRLYVSIGHTQPTSGDIKKEKLVEELVRNRPQDSSLTRNDFDIQEVWLNYGMGDKNPIECIKFFNKKNPQAASSIKREEVSEMLPQRFQEVEYWMILKSDSQHYMTARKMFEDSCSQLGLEFSHEVDPTHLSSFAPVEFSRGVKFKFFIYVDL
ncbi:deoxynucleoside triphosphate triphosphohydrolase SAMHD1-like [Palaemon carinicauda]|uniref:deoxynucleoside triphosphate triphosphohydrolase SAMHD1-like n=1 Tax=Palaemon carinicauda TaxID=392227 RepID=UPI0035B5CEE1